MLCRLRVCPFQVPIFTFIARDADEIDALEESLRATSLKVQGDVPVRLLDTRSQVRLTGVLHPLGKTLLVAVEDTCQQVDRRWIDLWYRGHRKPPKARLDIFGSVCSAR